MPLGGDYGWGVTTIRRDMFDCRFLASHTR